MMLSLAICKILYSDENKQKQQQQYRGPNIVEVNGVQNNVSCISMRSGFSLNCISLKIGLSSISYITSRSSRYLKTNMENIHCNKHLRQI